MRVEHRHADAPLRDPVEEVHRPVERIDDPLQPARSGLIGTLLLGEEGIGGPALGDQCSDRVLGGEVGLAERIGGRRLARDALLAAGLEARAQQRAGVQRRLAGHIEQLARIVHGSASAGRRASHGAAASSWAASESSNSSDPNAATS